jgi:hypothetical protein
VNATQLPSTELPPAGAKTSRQQYPVDASNPLSEWSSAALATDALFATAPADCTLAGDEQLPETCVPS